MAKQLAIKTINSTEEQMRTGFGKNRIEIKINSEIDNSISNN
jgi:hypothetical protein